MHSWLKSPTALNSPLSFMMIAFPSVENKMIDLVLASRCYEQFADHLTSRGFLQFGGTYHALILSAREIVPYFMLYAMVVAGGMSLEPDINSILTGIEHYFATPTPLHVLAYFGHGDIKGNWGFKTMSERTGIVLRDDVLKRWTRTLRTNNSHSRHLLLFMDCCHSGSWVDALHNLSYQEQKSISVQASSKADQESKCVSFPQLWAELCNGRKNAKTVSKDWAEKGNGRPLHAHSYSPFCNSLHGFLDPTTIKTTSGSGGSGGLDAPTLLHSILTPCKSFILVVSDHF